MPPAAHAKRPTDGLSTALLYTVCVESFTEAVIRTVRTPGIACGSHLVGGGYLELLLSLRQRLPRRRQLRRGRRLVLPGGPQLRLRRLRVPLQVLDVGGGVHREAGHAVGAVGQHKGECMESHCVCHGPW